MHVKEEHTTTSKLFTRKDSFRLISEEWLLLAWLGGTSCTACPLIGEFYLDRAAIRFSYDKIKYWWDRACNGSF